MSGSWQRALQGLAHPHTGLLRPITFDHNLASGRDDVVLVHLNHPLVQMSMRLLRAAIWSQNSHHSLHRATARCVPGYLFPTPMVCAHARLVLVGADGQRLHEELIAAGGEIHQGRFRRLNVSQVNAALEAAGAAAAGPAVQERLLALWPVLRPALLDALNGRASDRSESLHKLLAERAAAEADDMTAILTELQRSIAHELAEPPAGSGQLELFPAAEREQFQRNQAALRRRLAEIPGEILQEQARIAARYAAPQARLFPVAVTFLIPDSESR